jgi:hypothetical protein
VPGCVPADQAKDTSCAHAATAPAAVWQAAYARALAAGQNGAMGNGNRARPRTGSAGSILSIGSSGSILSIGSTGSILSIGSAGSILSIGSAGSLASVLSVGSFASAGSVLSGLSCWSVLAWRSRGPV